MKTGDIVIEKNGDKAVVHTVYSKTKVSLCLENYDTVGDMVERDFQTDISSLSLTNKNIFINI